MIREIDFSDLAVGLPAILAMTVMPFTYSISNGIGAAFVLHAFLMLGSILVPPLTEQAGAQRCGSSYVKCELRNPGQFWAILNPRQQTKVLRKRRDDLRRFCGGWYWPSWTRSDRLPICG